MNVLRGISQIKSARCFKAPETFVSPSSREKTVTRLTHIGQTVVLKGKEKQRERGTFDEQKEDPFQIMYEITYLIRNKRVTFYSGERTPAG